VASGPHRLHIVTGKGGTGKSTVAAALALALAGGGRRVLLMEVEGRQGIAGLFDLPPLPYSEQRVAVAPGHGVVIGLAVDPAEALLDYLEMFYNLRSAGRMLRRLGAVDFATTIAPGMRDVLLTGKLKEAVDRRKDGRPVYDAVVVDAPPTGRITRFLNVTQEVVGLAKVGPIKGQAASVQRVLRSDRTAVHIVTLLEEMPVQETVDAVHELRSAGLPLGHVLVNMRRGGDELEAPVPAAELALNLKAVDGLVAETVEHIARTKLEGRERQELQTLGLPMAELPLLTEGIDLGALYRLAETLQAQGMAQ